MPPIRIAVLSTEQEVVNLISVEAVRLRHRGADLRVDILQTAHAVGEGWGVHLRAVLLARGVFSTLVPLSSFGVTDEFHPAQVRDRLIDHYRREQSVCWAYSGAQKAQSVAMFAAFAARARTKAADEAVSVELARGGVLHVNTAGGAHIFSPIDLEITIAEVAALRGKCFTRPGVDLLAPLPAWTGPLPAGPFALARFQGDPDVRRTLYDWSARAKGALFEAVVAERIARFLARGTHRIADARWDLDRRPAQHDFLFAHRAGRMVGLDAKLGLPDPDKPRPRGASEPSFRAQWRACEEVAGPNCGFYYVVPWFPNYLHATNFDFEWAPEGPANPGGRFERVWMQWRDADENFADRWPVHRPPDQPSLQAFFHSRFIPFDAGDLFERRLKDLLC